jgi:hypothetical protein
LVILGIDITIFIFLGIVVLIGYTVDKQLSKTRIKEKFHSYIAWAVMIVFFGSLIFVEKELVKNYGDHIGNYFESTGYTADYYVNVFEGNLSAKNYELIAEIYRDEDTGNYLINKFTWPNGGYSEFDNYSYDNPLIVGERVWIKDDNNKIWYVQLTNKKAK